MKKLKKLKKLLMKIKKTISIGNDVNEIELENIKNESKKNW